MNSPYTVPRAKTILPLSRVANKSGTPEGLRYEVASLQRHPDEQSCVGLVGRRPETIAGGYSETSRADEVGVLQNHPGGWRSADWQCRDRNHTRTVHIVHTDTRVLTDTDVFLTI